jgi:predicted ATPase
MLLKSLQLTNFLSFGASTQALELRSLNVVIGPNGSGKSNLIEAIGLLHAAPSERGLQTTIREGGGVRDWLWKGGAQLAPTASINAVLDYPAGKTDLRYILGFTEEEQRFKIQEEHVKKAYLDAGDNRPAFYYRLKDGRGVINVQGRRLLGKNIELTSSILAQRKDPDRYPELTCLGDSFSKIRLYREWTFGRYATPRLPQKVDMPNDSLEPDAKNLAMVLNRLRCDFSAKKKLLNALHALYDGIGDFDVKLEGGTALAFLQEGQYIIPATQLSDGTLRYLCLLAILCHPEPPPLICIEEPELGLHPDVLPTLANLLKDAAERTQLIVTTHSDVLVDALTDQPEAVVVAEREAAGTTLTRLDAEKLKPWLEKYRLGQLWTSGDIGGTRW